MASSRGVPGRPHTEAGRTLRIGIDARVAAEVPAGRGRLLRELLPRLLEIGQRHELLLYARRSWEGGGIPATQWRLVPGRDPGWQLRAAPRINRECDVYFATNSYLATALVRLPTVVLVQDLAPFHRELGTPRAGALERLTLGLAVQRSAAIVTTTDATRRELIARHPGAAGRTHVVPLAADPSFRPGDRDESAVPERYGLGSEFVLAVGTLEPRKNLPRLIAAFDGLPESLRSRYRLAIVGAEGWLTGPTLASIAAHPEHVRALGHVPEEDLQALYRAATVFCYPSLYEGFGLPVLEAMQSGTAVAASGTSSLPEVGGDAVRYFDPRDVSDIRGALEELLADGAMRRDLVARGLEQAARFDWRKTAEAVLEQLELAAGRSA